MEDATTPPVVMQREDEAARIVVPGLRSDDGTTCSLVVVRETDGRWCLYPHGVARFGVRLSGPEARYVAREILGDGGS